MMLLHHAWQKYTVALLWEPRDLWFGVYWRTDRARGYRELVLYICLVPCLPLRFEIYFPLRT